jgi:hypothetical protein
MGDNSVISLLSMSNLLGICKMLIDDSQFQNAMLMLQPSIWFQTTEDDNCAL